MLCKEEKRVHKKMKIDEYKIKGSRQITRIEKECLAELNTQLFQSCLMLGCEKV